MRSQGHCNPVKPMIAVMMMMTGEDDTVDYVDTSDDYNDNS